MTPTEKLLAEQEKIVAERGYYIRPVRMANLMLRGSSISSQKPIAQSAMKNAALYWRSWREPSMPRRRM